MTLNQEIAALQKRIVRGNQEIQNLIRSKSADWDAVAKMDETVKLMEQELARKLRERDLNNLKNFH